MAFIDGFREHHDKDVVVLIPVALPTQLRYQVLHNHLDLILTNALRTRPDVISARITMPLDGDDHHPDGQLPLTGDDHHPDGQLPVTGDEHRPDGQ